MAACLLKPFGFESGGIIRRCGHGPMSSMAKFASLELFLSREAVGAVQRLRDLPEELFERLRARFGAATGPVLLDDEGLDMFWSTPQDELLLHLPPIRVWFIDAMDARLANLWELRDLRLTCRQKLLTLSDYRPHVARVIWYRQRLAVRSYWAFFLGARARTGTSERGRVLPRKELP